MGPGSGAGAAHLVFHFCDTPLLSPVHRIRQVLFRVKLVGAVSLRMAARNSQRGPHARDLFLGLQSK